jgi:hypothetical protein
LALQQSQQSQLLQQPPQRVINTIAPLGTHGSTPTKGAIPLRRLLTTPPILLGVDPMLPLPLPSSEIFGSIGAANPLAGVVIQPVLHPNIPLAALAARDLMPSTLEKPTLVSPDDPILSLTVDRSSRLPMTTDDDTVIPLTGSSLLLLPQPHTIVQSPAPPIASLISPDDPVLPLSSPGTPAIVEAVPAGLMALSPAKDPVVVRANLVGPQRVGPGWEGAAPCSFDPLIPVAEHLLDGGLLNMLAAAGDQ